MHLHGRMTKYIAAIALSFAACSSDAPEPGPDASTLYDECSLLCSEIDTDPLSLPNNQCPGPDDDTSYARCVGECVSRMPAGHWCAAP